MAGRYPDPIKPPSEPDPINSDIRCHKHGRSNNLFSIVANRNTTNYPNPDLIKLTEKLAEEAKNGRLKGLGGFAEYEDGYIFGLEGSYLENPESAIVPLKRLDRRIMDDIEKED